MNFEAISTMLFFVVGAFVTLAVLLSTHKSQMWQVDLVPENTVKPGDDVLVPVGSEHNARRMRVVAMAGQNRCVAIDVKDQQHYNGLAIGMAAAWPVMLPLVALISFATFMVNRVSVSTKQRAMGDEVAECMREASWKL